MFKEQKSTKNTTEDDWEVFFNKDMVIFAYSKDFKEKMLNHPRVIAEYLKEKETK